ncbi:TIGR00341 family protein [Brasilonema sp. UFV-L1]|uniref:TIGR00341 family protein n=1 Tax=Brasilonema sp. UFV-L1 TaxID=2234130 RepID=UPI00145DEC40|nr:TIGR00341 family protein [Brasilonema sp. UFV-L1]NMG09264.1 TIGR00341 family protein [Brasilonema sp. UFV-L1]
MPNINDIRQRFNNFTNKRVAQQELEEIRSGLLEESSIDINYLVLILGSCVIATLGLLSNSAAVIIGAMIIAPLMLPIRGLAFGALEGDVVLFRKAFTAIIIGTALAMTLALLIGYFVGLPQFGSEIISRSKPNLLDLGIAVAAGGISGFAKVQPKISGSLAGTAIAVALMPPICVVGLGLSQGNLALSLGATLLYLTNLLGITLSCMLTFLLTGYTPLKHARKVLGWTLAFTAILLIPLSAGFFQLIRQAQLEVSLRRALLNRTVTFQRVILLNSDVNWLTHPPEVRLSVRAKEPVTPRQVMLLEEFLKKEMGQPFTLIFEVGQIEEVKRDTPDDSKFDQIR